MNVQLRPFRTCAAMFLLLAVCVAQNSSPGNGSASFPDALSQAQEASQAKQWTKAVILWEELVKENPVTGDYWLQLASARYKTIGTPSPLIRKAMEVGVNGLRSAIPYEIARCYAQLGDRDAALDWFEKAMKLGYRDLNGAQHDSDLQPIAADPKFRELTAWVDPSTMSRDEGWRYDLRLMQREIERRGYAPFRLTSRQEFDRRVAALDVAIPKLTDMQIVTEMMKLTAAVGDGHTMI